MILTMATPSLPASMLPRSPTWRYESVGAPCFSCEITHDVDDGDAVDGDDGDDDDDGDVGDKDDDGDDKDRDDVGSGGRSRAMFQLRDSFTVRITHCQLSDGDDDGLDDLDDDLDHGNGSDDDEDDEDKVNNQTV